MNHVMRYEVIAEAFHIETGYTAPGKSRSAAAGAQDEDEAKGRWDEWNGANRSIINAMCMAFTRVMPQESEE